MPHYKLFVAVFTPVIAGLLAAGQLCAQSRLASDQEPSWFDHGPDNAWLQPYDPTLISRRSLSEFSFESLDNGDKFWTIENSLRWGFPVGEDLAMGLQFMAPVKWIDTNEADESGIGDFQFRTGFVGRFSPSLRWGTGVNVKLDTATDSAIGDNAMVLRPILAVSWDANKHINLGLNFEYEFTTEDEGDDDVSALQVKVPMAVRITDNWSSAVTYKPRRNFLAETDRHRFELGTTRLFGSRRQFALSLGVELPLSPEAFDHKAIFGFATNF